MRKTVVGLLALLAAASGCSRYYWSKPGATEGQFVRDNRECVQQAAGALPPEEPPTLAGRWYGRDRSTLDIKTMGGRVQWEWERSNDRGTVRATGGGTASGRELMLVEFRRARP